MISKNPDEFKWSLRPYPHIIVDNFLASDTFDALCIELDNSEPRLKTRFKTALEDKSIFEFTSLGPVSSSLTSLLGSERITSVFSRLLGNISISSLFDADGFSSYSPYHITKPGGFLGSHVDHSFLTNPYLYHIGNSIFYASTEWKKNWGGQTVLFNESGLSIERTIDPIPNRLILFIHTSKSFHGVLPYIKTAQSNRRTFYHDYYIKPSLKPSALSALNHLYQDSTIKFELFAHDTTFIPCIPFGLRGLNASTLFSPSNAPYLLPYIKYIRSSLFSMLGRI